MTHGVKQHRMTHPANQSHSFKGQDAALSLTKQLHTVKGVNAFGKIEAALQVQLNLLKLHPATSPLVFVDPSLSVRP